MSSKDESPDRPGRLRRMIRKVRGLPWVTPRERRTRYVGATLIALLAAGSISQIAVAQAHELPEGAVFRIGDSVLTEQQFGQRTQVLEALYGVKAPADPPKRDQFRRASAKAIAVSDILDRAKQGEGVVIADKEASDQLDKLIQTGYPQGGRQQFIAALGQGGISEPDVIDEIKRQLGNGQLFDKLTRGTAPATPADARAAYDQRRDKMVQPEQRQLRNLVVDSPDKANQALNRVKTGEDFGAVTREVSIDASTKDKGGDLGTVAQQQLDPAYGTAAFSAPDNGFYGPIQFQQGWHIGQVVEVKPAVPLSFEQVQKQLIDQLNSERKLNTWNTWLQDQILAADVQYADKYRPANPNEQPTGEAPR